MENPQAGRGGSLEAIIDYWVLRGVIDHQDGTQAQRVDDEKKCSDRHRRGVGQPPSFPVTGRTSPAGCLKCCEHSHRHVWP